MLMAWTVIYILLIFLLFYLFYKALKTQNRRYNYYIIATFFSLVILLFI